MTLWLHSITERSQARNSKQKPEVRDLSRGHEGSLLTDLLLLIFSACFLIYCKTTCVGVALPTVGQALLHQSFIKKMSTDLSIDQFQRGIFSIKRSSYQMTLTCVKLTKTQLDHWHRALSLHQTLLPLCLKDNYISQSGDFFICMISFYRRQYVHRIYLAAFNSGFES